jgi:hypothetical protein
LGVNDADKVVWRAELKRRGLESVKFKLMVAGVRPAPLSKTPAISRFSGWARSRFAFRREKMGNCGSFRPDGTTRRSFSRMR